MANVRININEKTYAIDCGAGQESRVQQLAAYIDERMASLRNTGASISQDQLFVITSLMLTDEIFEMREEMERMAANANSSEPQIIEPDYTGMISEEKVAAIIAEVGNRISSLTREVEAL